MADVVEFPKLRLVTPPEPIVDKVCVETLELALKDAKEGKLSSVSIAGVTPDFEIVNYLSANFMRHMHELISAHTFAIRRIQNLAEHSYSLEGGNNEFPDGAS